MFRQHGANVLPLSEVVDNLMAAQQNTRRSHYLSTLVNAKWIWKELLRTTVFSVRQMVVPVVNGRVTIPSGIENVMSLSAVNDCNDIVALVYNPAINTMHLAAPESKCSCNKCDGTDTLCAIMDTIIYRTEDIVVDGQTLQKRIWNRTDPCGELYEVTQTPVVDPVTDLVVYLESYKSICKVQLNADGCLLNTPENERVLRMHCGCYMLERCCDSTPNRQPVLHSDFGSWNWQANSNSVIHLRDVRVTSLILACETNGDCDDGEMLVPEFAVEALTFGTKYRQEALAPHSAVPLGAKAYSRDEYNRKKEALLKYLHPIDAAGFMELGSIIPKWG